MQGTKNCTVRQRKVLKARLVIGHPSLVSVPPILENWKHIRLLFLLDVSLCLHLNLHKTIHVGVSKPWEIYFVGSAWYELKTVGVLEELRHF